VRLRSTVAAIACFIAAWLLASRASAQVAGGFAIDRFNPSERGSEWFALDSLDIRGAVRPAIGVAGEFAYRPLTLRNVDRTIRVTPIHERWIIHPGASLVLGDRLRIAFDLPVVPYQTGKSGTLDDVFYSGVTTAAKVGDLRLGADARVAGSYGGPFRLSVGIQFFVPTGDRASYLSDGVVRILPRAQVAGDISWFSYAAMAGFEYRSLDETFEGTRLGSEFVFGASAGVHGFHRTLMLGPEIYGSTVVDGGPAFRLKKTPVEVLFGMHVLVGSAVRLGLGVGPGITSALGEPMLRAIASIEWAPRPPQPPPTDLDRDGIPDLFDACPVEPGVRTGDPSTNGCPPPAPPPPPPPPPPDADGDGIADADDACPDVRGVANDDPKQNGCPPDRDKDGVVDDNDACPDVAGIKTDDPKTNGCPDTDRDKDGIPNDVDACPDAAGPSHTDPKKNGCPQAAVVGKRIVIVDQVKFATGSAKLLSASDEVLGAVLHVLQEHTEIGRVTVEGHTDDVGAAAMNKALSARRAAAVVDWLVKHGVDRARLASVGYGKERPIDSNATPQGRQNNRRVEFHIQDTAGHGD